MSNILDLDKYNVQYMIPAITLDYIKNLEFSLGLQYSIYLYAKKDLIQLNTPAIFISFENLVSKNTGYRYEGDLVIEFVNNNTRNNRVSSFNIESAFKNHLMLSVISSTNYYLSLVKKAPYITFVSNNNFRVKETKTGFKLITRIGWLFQIYKNWLEEVQYSPSGALDELTQILNIKEEVVIG